MLQINYLPFIGEYKHRISTHFNIFENIVIIVQELWTFGTLVDPRMIKCILLFSFVFKPSHDATFSSSINQTHV